MNKTAIQKYAIWARNELRNQITQRAFQYGITPKERPEKCLASVNGIMLTPIEQKQRDQLVEEVWRKGFDQVIEELAYTWFNRLIAIRFMEVNDYLPEGVRVLSNSRNEFKPEILTSALNLDEAHFKKNLILKLIDEGKQEELYRYLLLAECNALNEILPVMFERMDGYTELMLPSNLLKSDSVIGKLISDINEADWKVTGSEDEEGGQVQIIGWLYQYYNSELKDEAFADLKKKNKKISKERIPAATQLFTPDWIVRYMVENSLGRLWLEGHPNEELKKNWKYYLDEAEQEPEVEAQLKEIRKEYAALRPEDLSTADLAMGSGHILVYAFDVLMQIYRSEGYRDRDAVKSILENNLYGLDIDDRAAQLAYFAIMMKAREYDRRIFDRGIQPNVFAIQESNGISEDAAQYFANGDKELKADVEKLISGMKDAKEYGSIITASKLDYSRIDIRLEELKNDYNLYAKEARDRIQPLVGPAKILSSSVWVCCMNPPYMGSDNMSLSLKKFVQSQDSTVFYDLYAVFFKRGKRLLYKNGLQSIITQNSFLYALCFEEFRTFLLNNESPINMVHLGPGAFDNISGEVVQTVAAVYRKEFSNYRSTFIRLIDNANKKEAFLSAKPYRLNWNSFSSLPHHVFSYTADNTDLELFNRNKTIGDYFDSKAGIVTGKDSYFLKFWFEVSFLDINLKPKDIHNKYVLFSKGGSFSKWSGNKDYVIRLEDLWTDTLTNNSVRRGDRNAYFKPCIGWSYMGGGNKKNFSYLENCVCGTGTPTILSDTENLMYVLALLNTHISEHFINLINPTLNTYIGDICSIPLIIDNDKKAEISRLAKQCIDFSEQLQSSSELNPLFKNFYLCDNKNCLSVKDALNNEISIRNKILEQISHNEAEIQRLFKSIYKISSNGEGSLSKEFRGISKSDLVKDFISYFVGCSLGRFKYKKPGISTEFEFDKDSSIDQDNIIPIGEDEYFDDDLTALFIKWLKSSFSEETLEDNLQFIADALGGKGTPRVVIRKYFLNDFFKDHCKTYKKHPIYWLFDSGKKNGFKCLIYMHRYQPDTIARIRTDYVHEQQERYRSQIKHINDSIDDTPKSEQVKMRKQLKDLTGKLDEVTKYEEKVHHLADQMIKIDLDDGVKHNYALFQDVLAKIK
ncbi:BREX-1 system adenine-specific DNA-methyltransferase PglX [Faecalibaculum rodentium]|uniref:BREX-1 system adenine-specific DNA-methyltransferase PglX n=1 Tax=Faecalibaculum rodentium TaxID=1702221 RepID=UPI0023F3812E|nr:BREX-1 system adenine-specific DNA-methyltransferase PglX [Faecalibaculum rodentium]